MSILVTGGAGFIGSHLVERMLERGEHVVVIDNFDPFYDPEIKENNVQKAMEYDTYTLYRDDILDINALQRIFDKHNFDVIVHLAAKAGVRPSIKDPINYSKVNIEGTVNILEKCKKHEINNFIFASSSSVYGNNKKVPFSEEDPVDSPISPYAATKKSCELICYTYHHLFNINIFALRFFTVYGPRQRPEMAINKFIRMISNGSKVPLYGRGKPERDFTYIDDIIDGIESAIEENNGFEVINLGGSRTISVNYLVDLIQKHLGIKANKEYLSMQPGDVIKTYADLTKAKKLLEYQPVIDIEKGIKEFVEWYNANKRLYYV